jgi:hypothetical protein
MNPQPKEKWKVKPVEVMPVASYRTNFLSKSGKKNKYGAKKQTYNGVKYDSTFESKVAEDLDWQLKAGELVEIKRQVKIAMHVNGVFITNYYVDFRTVDRHGQVTYVEAKGIETKDFLIKKRLFIALLPEIDNGAEYKMIKS